ncbi:MAG: hypothetical protein QMD08_07790 [Actinomycetota bacterium]|nr:hypothetical protein [Actinomycetota bacterium]
MARSNDSGGKRRRFLTFDQWAAGCLIIDGRSDVLWGLFSPREVKF